MRGLPDLSFELEEAVLTALRSNTALVTLLGNNAQAIRQRFTNQAILVPSIGIQRIGDIVTETEVPVLLQFDFFGEGLQQARALRRLTLQTLYSDYHFTLGSLLLWTEYQGTRRESDPEDGTSYLSTDITFHPYREYET